MGDPPSHLTPITLSKALSPNNIALGVKDSTLNGVGDLNIQSITSEFSEAV